MARTIDCEVAQKHFGAVLSREIKSQDERALKRHLAGCDSCEDRYAQGKAAWGLMGQWEDEVPPVSLEGRIRGRIAEAMRVDASAEMSGGIQMGREVVLPTVLGVLFALISVKATLWNMDMGQHALSKLIVSVAVWSGLYVSVFIAIFRRARLGGIDFGRLAKLALAGTAGALLFFSYCPISSEEEICHMLPFLTPLFELAGGTPAYFILGVISAILPMFLLTAIVGKRIETVPGEEAIIIAVMIAVLIMPALVLQKAPLTFDVIAIALGSTGLGLFAGSFLGTIAGLWTTSRVGVTHAT